MIFRGSLGDTKLLLFPPTLPSKSTFFPFYCMTLISFSSFAMIRAIV